MSKPIKVALVDDHQLFRKGLTAILNANPKLVIVLEADNGHSLLEQLDDAPKPDVFVLDLEMPVMDGMQTLTALRKRDPEAKVVLLTMHTDERFVVHFMESGANSYLLKSTSPQEVEEAIVKVHEAGFYFNDSVSQAMLKGLQKKNQDTPSLPGGESLAEREIEVLKLICMELTTPEIGEKMFLSPRTIEGYRKKLLEKTGAKNTAGLVLFAVRAGLV